MSFFNQAKNRKPGFNLALFSVGVAVIVVGLGAFTRLADAGLGCPDWPGCYGHFTWPDEAHEISAANEAFPHAPVELDKTWPEMVHRYFASSLGLLCIFLLVVALRSKLPDQPKKLPVFLLGFIILQGMFGMWTVTLKLWPQVVTAHLLGGFTTLSLLWLMTLRLNNQHWSLLSLQKPPLDRLKPVAIIAFIAVVAQIAIGGWLTSNYAAVACPDLPFCQGQVLPPMDFAQGFDVFQHVGPNYLGGQLDNDARVAIHMTHRFGAFVVLLLVSYLVYRLFRCDIEAARPIARVMGAVLVLQLLLGLANVFFNLPIAVATAHNLVGAMLLLTQVTTLYYLYSAKVR